MKGTMKLALVLAAGSLGCVGQNPDWDEPISDSRSGPTATDGVESETETWSEGTSSDAGAATTGGSSGALPEPEACLEQGLAWCEAESVQLCADLAKDAEHCGDCFHDCTLVGAECKDGVCECHGKWGFLCDGICTETRDNPHACGSACENCISQFGPDAVCKDGVCGPDDDDDDGGGDD